MCLGLTIGHSSIRGYENTLDDMWSRSQVIVSLHPPTGVPPGLTPFHTLSILPARSFSLSATPHEPLKAHHAGRPRSHWATYPQEAVGPPAVGARTSAPLDREEHLELSTCRDTS